MPPSHFRLGICKCSPATGGIPECPSVWNETGVFTRLPSLCEHLTVSSQIIKLLGLSIYIHTNTHLVASVYKYTGMQLTTNVFAENDMKCADVHRKHTPRAHGGVRVNSLKNSFAENYMECLNLYGQLIFPTSHAQWGGLGLIHKTHLL